MPAKLKYQINNQIELNFSYLPFIKDGGLFIRTTEKFQLGEQIDVEVRLPGQTESIIIEGNVVWVTPSESLYQVYPGIGIQFIGPNAKVHHDLIKANIDNTLDVGGYAYGAGNALTI